MSTATAKLYELPGGAVKEGAPADLMIFDKDEKWVVPDKFASKAVNSPFIGETMPGVIKYTIASGKVVYKTV
jgi:dihydroorotase